MTTSPTPTPRSLDTGGDARRRLLAGLPVTERRLPVAGTSTVVLEGGHGPPVLLLHGGIECGGAVWAPIVSALAERHRVVVPDLPGLGASAPVERLDAAAFADWLLALLERTGLQRPVLVAHSLAGSLAAGFAARHGHLLGRLVLYAAPGIGTYRMPVGLRWVALRFTLRPSERNAERFDRWAFSNLDRARERDPEWFRAFAADTSSRATVPHTKRTMGQLLKAGRRRVPDDELRRIGVPTSLAWGRGDRFVPLALAQAASTRLGWPLRVIDGTGHVPHVEQPPAFLQAAGLHEPAGR